MHLSVAAITRVTAKIPDAARPQIPVRKGWLLVGAVELDVNERGRITGLITVHGHWVNSPARRPVTARMHPAAVPYALCPLVELMTGQAAAPRDDGTAALLHGIAGELDDAADKIRALAAQRGDHP